MEFSLRVDTRVEGFCEYGNETSGTAKCCETV
jgi:hypothetical protein